MGGGCFRFFHFAEYFLSRVLFFRHGIYAEAVFISVFEHYYPVMEDILMRIKRRSADIICHFAHYDKLMP